MIFVHSFQLMFRQCDYPQGFMWWIGFHAVLFWFLFYDFFYTSYTKRTAAAAAKKAALKLAANGHLNCNGIANGKDHMSNGNVHSSELAEEAATVSVNGHAHGSKSSNGQLVYRKKNGVAADLLKLRENEAEVDSHQY
jgi:hypothetical protein